MDHNFFLITVHVMIFSPHIRLDIDEDEETTSGDGIDDQHEEKMRTSTNFHGLDGCGGPNGPGGPDGHTCTGGPA